MSLHELADSTAKQIVNSLETSEDQLAVVSRIVEDALTKAIEGTREGCVETVYVCCSADQDLAHKIARDISRKEEMLIANLSSMR